MRENQEFTHEKNAEKQVSESQFLKMWLFWEIEFSMPNFITQCLRCPKMEKSRLGFNFVIHDYEQNHGQWFFKVPFYLFDQSGHKTIHDFCYYTTEDILGQH